MIFLPHQSDSYFTRRKSKVMIGFCWVVPFLMLLPSRLGVYGVHGLECNSRSCTLMDDDHGHNPKDIFLVIGLALPSLVLAVTNLLILYRVISIKDTVRT